MPTGQLLEMDSAPTFYKDEKSNGTHSALQVTFSKLPSRSPSSFPLNLFWPQLKVKISLMEEAPFSLAAALALRAVEVEMEMESRSPPLLLMILAIKAVACWSETPRRSVADLIPLLSMMDNTMITSPLDQIISLMSTSSPEMKSWRSGWTINDLFPFSQDYPDLGVVRVWQTGYEILLDTWNHVESPKPSM